MTPVIELEGFSVRFGERDILKDLRASLSGRTIGLLGPNGAGKSTLINTLLGFHQPSAARRASSATTSARNQCKSAGLPATCRRTTRSSPT